MRILREWEQFQLDPAVELRIWPGGASIRRRVAQTQLGTPSTGPALSKRWPEYQAEDWRRMLRNGKTALLRETSRGRNSVRAWKLLDIDRIEDTVENLSEDDGAAKRIGSSSAEDSYARSPPHSSSE